MDIRQFAYAGIDVYGLLADYTGKTTEEIKDMEISYEDLSGALQKASSEGGKYFNAMTKASETTEGQAKQLKVEVKEMTGQLAKGLMPEIKRLLGYAKDLIGKFDNLSDEEKKNITNMLLFTAAVGPAIKILGTLGTGIGTTIKGVGTLSQAVGVFTSGAKSANATANALATGMSLMTNPIGAAVLALGAVTTAMILLSSKETEAQKKSKELQEAITNQKQAFEDYNNSVDSSAQAEMAHVNSASKLKDELKELVDENGKVKDGYESRVSFILNELNKALGTEYNLNGDVIESYQNLQSEIDT